MTMRAGASDHLSFDGRKLILPSGMTASEDAVLGDVTLSNGGLISPPAGTDFVISTDPGTGAVERGRISAAGVGSGMFKEFTIPGGTLFAIGDSITANGNGSGIVGSSLTLSTRISATSYLAWAALQSGGKIFHAGASGTSGYTAAQILATHVPVAIANNPGMCVVLAGTNDVVAIGLATETIAQCITNMKAIYTTLLAGGIMPVCCTIPPANGASANANKARAQLNAWITAYAAKKRLPFVDFYSVLADPATAGNYLSTLNTDATHPNAAGAKVMGLALYNALQPMLPNQSNPLLTMNNGDTGFGYTNSLFLTDTNADGVPDNWTLSGTGAVGALAADANIKGNYWSITRGTTDALGQQTGTIAYSPGDVIYVGMRLMSSVKGVGATFDAQIVGASSQVLLGLQAFTEDLASGTTFAGIITVPAGAAAGNLLAQVNVKGVANGVAKIGQLTVMNMTAAGLDLS